MACGIGVAVCVVVPDKLVDVIEVGLDVCHENRSLQDGIRNRLGNFRFAPARNGARFVAKRALGHGADQAPGAAGGRFRHVDFVAARQHVAVLKAERNLARLPVLLPSHFLGQQLETRILRNVKNIRMLPVDRVALRMHLDGITEQVHGLGKAARHIQGQILHRDLLGQVVARKNERASRMLLLRIAEEVGRHAELRFDLLFAIAEVVVGNDRHHHTTLVTCRDLEGRAIVVDFVRRLPAHPVAPLTLGCFVPRRQAEFRLGQLVEVRGQNDAARVAGPMLGIESGIVVGEIRIARIAENAFDKVEIADQSARHKEAHLHAFLRRHSRHPGADHRTEQEGNKALGRGRKGRGEGQAQQLRRGIERRLEQSSEDRLRHRLLVVRHRQTPFGHMKNALRGTAVALRIVQHTLAHAVGIDDVGRKFVLVRRQGQLPCETVPVESEGLVGQARHLDHVLQVVVEKILDARVGGGKVLGQQPVFFAMQRHEPADQIGKLGILFDRIGRAPEVPQLEVDVEDAPAQRIRILAAAGPAAELADFLFEICIHDKNGFRLTAGRIRGQDPRDEIALASRTRCRHRLAAWEKNCPHHPPRRKRSSP